MAVGMRGRIRVRLAWWLHAAVFALVTALAFAVGSRRGTDLTPYLLPPLAFGAFLVVERTVVNRPCRIGYSGGVLTLGRFAHGPVDGEVPLGNWYAAGVGASIGTVAHVRVQGRAVRIGGRGVPVPANASGPPARTVKITLSGAGFRALMGALGVDVTGAARTVHIDLFGPPGKNRASRLQTLIALAVALPAIGVVAALVLTRRQPPVAVYAGAAAAITTAVLLAAWRWGGACKPIAAQRRLTLGPAAVQLWRDRRLIASGVPVWRPGVWVTETLLHTAHRTPVIELTLPRQRPIVIGYLGHEIAWPATEKLPAPRYYVSEVDWPRLASQLRTSPP